MRTFFATHWKSIVALIILVLVAVLTMSPGGASPELAARLRLHVQAIDGGEHSPASAGRAARYIEATLAAQGYQVHRHEQRAGATAVGHIEAAIANVAAGARATRIFIVGAHYDPALGDNGSGAAAVLELARLLKTMHPGPGTELRFIFFFNHGSPGQSPPESEARYPGIGNFIAFAGSRAASPPVAQALAAFRTGTDAHAEGLLAAPAYVQGVTLSSGRDGSPALMVTDTAFLHSSWFPTAAGTADKHDYEDMARVIAGLSHTLAALAGTTAG